MRSIAGFPMDGKGYFLPRAQETPEEALSSRIWPEADLWLGRMQAYHPDRDDNEVVRLDLAGTGFLRLLRMLRVILLQDSVILRRQFPLYPLWKDSLFNCPDYLRFAARVEGSLADVVTPAELTMQRYWPAQEAVAKLRHEAVILGFQGIQSRLEEISERLGRMERSIAAFAPIWIQQGSTGIWIGPMIEFARASLPPLPQPLPRPDGPNLEASITSVQVSHEDPALLRSAPALAPPADTAAATTTSAPAPASTPAPAPASTPAFPSAFTPTSHPASAALALTPTPTTASVPPAEGPFEPRSP
jgi:hypothetical protein